MPGHAGAEHTMVASSARGPAGRARRTVPRPVMLPPGVALVVGAVLLLFSGRPATGRGSEIGNSPMSTTTLTLADSGHAVDLRLGDRLVLQLEENPTTGYRWALEPFDEEVLSLDDVAYAPAREGGLGGGGQRAWTFSARKPGTATLQLKLWRPWEGDASVTARFTAALQIRE